LITPLNPYKSTKLYNTYDRPITKSIWEKLGTSGMWKGFGASRGGGNVLARRLKVHI